MKNFGLLFIAILLSISSFSQDMSSVFQTQSATWYGLDFSEAYFIGSEGFTNPQNIKDTYFNSWNVLIKNEYDKYDIGKYFQKENVEFSLDNVTARNSGVSIYDRVIDDNSKMLHLDENKVQEMISSYEIGNEETGLGIVLIVESFSKTNQMANYFVTFFDIDSKKVLLTERMDGKAGGFGFRNYWAKTYSTVFKAVPKKMNNWKKKYNQ